MLRERYPDLDQEVRVYERMVAAEGRKLDTNEFMKIINLSYVDEEDDEIDIDSNLNLNDALSWARKASNFGDEKPCLKILVRLNRRIVPVDAAQEEKYLSIEDFKSERPRNELFSMEEVSAQKEVVHHEVVYLRKSSLLGEEKLVAASKPEEAPWEQRKKRNAFEEDDEDYQYVPRQEEEVVPPANYMPSLVERPDSMVAAKLEEIPLQ